MEYFNHFIVIYTRIFFEYSFSPGFSSNTVETLALMEVVSMILVKQVSVICAVGLVLVGGINFSAHAMQEESRNDILAEQGREQACRMAQAYLRYLTFQDMNPELTYDSRVQEAFLLGQLQHRNDVAQKVSSRMKQQLNEGLFALQEHEHVMSSQSTEKKVPGLATSTLVKSTSQPIACAQSARSASAPLKDPSISLLGSNVSRESPLMLHHLGIRTLPGFVKETYYAPAVIGLPTGEPENTESDR